MAQMLSQKIARKLDGLPGHYKNRVVFGVCRNLWYAKYRPAAPSSSDVSEAVDELRQNGFLVRPGHIGTSQAEAMAQELEVPMNAIREGRYDGEYPFYRLNEDGVYRLLKCDEAAPLTRAFFEDDFVHQVARSIVSHDVDSYQRMAELRPDVAVLSGADTPHFDDWRHRLKAFLYLTDVGPENAPLLFYRGSHKVGHWRKSKEYEYFKNGKRGTYGHFSPGEMGVLVDEMGFEPVSCVGPAGTLIIADTRGVHSGTVLKTGRRMMLSNYMDVRSQ